MSFSVQGLNNSEVQGRTVHLRLTCGKKIKTILFQEEKSDERVNNPESFYLFIKKSGANLRILKRKFHKLSNELWWAPIYKQVVHFHVLLSTMEAMLVKHFWLTSQSLKTEFRIPY